MSSLEDRLKAAKALIDKPEKWYQYGYRSKDGRNAICTIHSIDIVTRNEFGGESPARDTARREMIQAFGKHSRSAICDMNVTSTHSELMAHFDSAIAKASNTHAHPPCVTATQGMVVYTD